VGRELPAAEREQAREAWLEAMVGVIRSLYDLWFQNPDIARTLTLLDLPNLLAALVGLAEAADPDLVVETATRFAGVLQYLDRPQALARVVAVQKTAAEALGDWSHARFEASRAALDRLLDAGRLAEGVAAAEQLVHKGLAGDQAYPEAPYDLAGAYWYLGRALQSSGAASASLEPLEEARRRFQELADAGDPEAARMAEVTLTELGDSLAALGRLDEAGRLYQKSIRGAEEMGDSRLSAIARGQLGTAQRQLVLCTDDNYSCANQRRAGAG
jgi:tetratricopeptide (TPR) repeat protein